MIKKIKRIFELTKIFFKNSFENSYFIDKKNKKINLKSTFTWMLIIMVLALTYLSWQIIKTLIKINMAPVFLSGFFLVEILLIIFQTILASTNVYFFSKDFETILPLPIKSDELLIAKFNTILINVYSIEFLFGIIPLLIYGIFTNAGIIYFIYLILILIIFPILPTLIISIINMLLMKISKIIKNKNTFQIVITLLMLILVFVVEFLVSRTLIKQIDNDNGVIETESVSEFYNRTENANKYFLEINPTVNMLKNYNKFESILELAKIVLYNFVFFMLFIFIGKKYYLRNILKNNNVYYKKLKVANIEKKIKKKRSKSKAYLLKEIKNLIKNPTFFMQCIFPILIIIVSLTIIMIFATPNIKALMESDLLNEDNPLKVNIRTICMTLGIIELLSLSVNISITSVSREGKSAYLIKVIPIDYYKQIIYKSLPQIIFCTIFNLLATIFYKLLINDAELIHLIFIFIISTLLTIINSLLMVIVDAHKPNLDWKVEYEVFKQNNNKLYQYALIILIILLLTYFTKIFKDISLIASCSIITVILVIILVIINLLIKKNKNKIFKNIN